MVCYSIVLEIICDTEKCSGVVVQVEIPKLGKIHLAGVDQQKHTMNTMNSKQDYLFIHFLLYVVSVL